MISFTTTSLKQLHCHEKKTNETPQKVDHHRNCNYQSQRWSSDTHRLSASQSVIRACAVHTQSFISSKQKRADLWRRFRCFFLGFSKRAVEPLNSECHYGIASPFWQLTLKSASSVKVFSIHERLHMLVTLTCSS